MTDRHKRMLRGNFESQLFLYVNREFWCIEDVKLLEED